MGEGVRREVGEYRAQELGWKLIGRSDGVRGIPKLGDDDEDPVIYSAQLLEFRPGSGVYFDSEIGSTPGQPPFSSAPVLEDFETNGVRARKSNS